MPVLGIVEFVFTAAKYGSIFELFKYLGVKNILLPHNQTVRILFILKPDVFNEVFLIPGAIGRVLQLRSWD